MTRLQNNNTLPQLIRNVVQHIKSPGAPFMLEKTGTTFTPITYAETLTNADAVSAWFLENGIKKGDRLGLLIENCPRYVYYDQGLQQLGGINVSIYPTLSETDISFIINNAEIKTLLVGNTFLLRKVIKVAADCKTLTHIIPAFDDFQKVAATFSGPQQIISFSEILEHGKGIVPQYAAKIEEARNNVKPEDVASLIYTSGTTGSPKGAMLTHDNFIQNVNASLQQITGVTSDDVFLSFLPLSHVFERTATYHIALTKGAVIAFAQNLELLGKNMTEVHPTILITVPRLLERIAEKATKSGTVDGGIKAKIFNWAFEIGAKARKRIEEGKPIGFPLSTQLNLAQKLVFNKVIEKTGGSLKFIVSGGAALPPSVAEFFGNLGIKILEGYGLTETSPVMAVTELTRTVIGTVGRINPGLVVAIQHPDTKVMITEQTFESFNPTFESDEGEILVRGHCVMKGYWKNDEETAVVIDKNGWFHTGDIGKFHKGNLRITDRIKNILINSYGKNIYPTQVENVYLSSEKIEQIFLLGDKRDFITAIVVPSHDLLRKSFDTDEDFFDDPNPFIEEKKVHDWIKEDIRKLSKDLAKFEQVKNFVVKRHPFSIESGEMTPTLKTKRRVIETNYADKIDELYRSGEED